MNRKILIRKTKSQLVDMLIASRFDEKWTQIILPDGSMKWVRLEHIKDCPQ